MLRKIKFLTYTVLLLPNLAIEAKNTQSPLSSQVWKKNLQIGPYLKQTQEALCALYQQDPLFFTDLAPLILEEGLNIYAQSFLENNPHFIMLLSQDFETNPRSNYRTQILTLAKLMNNKLQETFFNKELHFLLNVSYKEYHLRTREIRAWINLGQNLGTPNKQALLMVYERARSPHIRQLLLQSFKKGSNTN